MISITSPPVTLERTRGQSFVQTTKSPAEGYVQSSVLKKVVGCLSKAQEEAMSVFVLIIFEVGDCFDVVELVEESASFPPSASSITDGGNAPRVGIQAWCSWLVEG